MYKIESRPSGFILTFGGLMSLSEMEEWYSDSVQALAKAPSTFGVIIDMRTLAPLPQDAQARMVQGQQMYKNRGMERSCVVVNNAVTAAQFKRLAQQSGIYAFERYIDASAHANWSDLAIAWVNNAVDPDK